MTKMIIYNIRITLACGEMVTHQNLDLTFIGSTPITPDHNNIIQCIKTWRSMRG